MAAAVLAGSIGLLFFVSTDARPAGDDAEPLASWTAEGKPVCVATGDQFGPVTVADGAGGVFTVWQDARDPQPQIYVQRLDSQGDPVAGWPSDGLPIAPSSGFQMSPAVTSDGSGGLLIGWVDTSPGLPQVFVQRVTSSGSPHPGWPATGLRSSPTTAGQSVPVLATDGAGGAFVAFQDLRSGSFNQIFVQRVLGDGSIAPGWPAPGVAASPSAASETDPRIADDGSGGVFVVWSDMRSGDADIRAQHLGPAGVPAAGWPTDGLVLCGATGVQTAPVVATDGQGGALVVWADARGASVDVYATRVGFAGGTVPGWPVDGAPACTASGHQIAPAIASDGQDGAFVAWQDLRGDDANIYATHFSGSGALAFGWPADGIAVCPMNAEQLSPRVVADGSGTAVVCWEDARYGTQDIYAQRLTFSGAVATGWPLEGVAVVHVSGNQTAPSIGVIARGIVVVSWQDGRSGALDIFAQALGVGGFVESTGPGDGFAVCTAVNAQSDLALAGDGAGGAVAAWTDDRFPASPEEVYAQRVTRSATVLWFPDGTPVSTTYAIKTRPAVASDGSGNIFVAWQQETLSIYVQRLGLTGLGQWTGGRLVYAGHEYAWLDLVPDGGGGVFAAWITSLYPATGLYLQHTSSYGTWLWVKQVAPGVADPRAARVVSDGQGGVIVVWSQISTSVDMYAQRFLADGQIAPGWPAGGFRVCTVPGGQFPPAIVADGNSGAVVVWHDWRTEPASVYAQRLTSDGQVAPGWPADGAPLCQECAPFSDHYGRTKVVSDGTGGAIYAWHAHGTAGLDADIRVQRIGADGVVPAGWPSGGLLVTDTAGDERSPNVATDGQGGAYVVWSDDTDVLAQHVTGDGSLEEGWPQGGFVVSGATGSQGGPLVVPDDAGGILVAWVDTRNALSSSDIYAQRVHSVAAVTDASEDLAGMSGRGIVFPNPSKADVRFSFRVGAAAQVEAAVYDAAGRRLRTLVRRAFVPGTHTLGWDGRNEAGDLQPSGVYFVVVHAGTDIFRYKLVRTR